MWEVAASILYIAGLLAKFRGKHVGLVLWCVASTHTTRRSLILLLVRPLPRPCVRWLAEEHRLLLTTTSYPSRTRWKDMQQLIWYCRSSNIIVCLLEEAKSQAQPERGSCERSCVRLCVGVGRGAEPWSTHIARLLHETKLPCKQAISPLLYLLLIV